MRTPYLLFLGDAPEFSTAKMAAGIWQWRPELSLGQYRLPGCGVDLGVPDMTPAEAAAAGAGTMIIGVVNVGGFVPDLRTCIDLNVGAARLTNREARAVGISINTSRMPAGDVDQVVAAIEAETGLPCCDPIRHGAGRIVEMLKD